MSFSFGGGGGFSFFSGGNSSGSGGRSGLSRKDRRARHRGIPTAGRLLTSSSDSSLQRSHEVRLAIGTLAMVTSITSMKTPMTMVVTMTMRMTIAMMMRTTTMMMSPTRRSLMKMRRNTLAPNLVAPLSILMLLPFSVLLILTIIGRGYSEPSKPSRPKKQLEPPKVTIDNSGSPIYPLFFYNPLLTSRYLIRHCHNFMGSKLHSGGI